MRLFYLFFLLSLYGRQSFATLVVPMDLPALTQKAPIVVYGKVVSVEENPSDGFRFAEIEPLDLARAPEDLKNLKSFRVPLMNRVLPGSDVVEVVASAPEFVVGEEVLVFLRPLIDAKRNPQFSTDGNPLFAIEGFYQGKFAVGRDRNGIRRAVAWNSGLKMPEFDASKIISARNQKLASPNKKTDKSLEGSVSILQLSGDSSEHPELSRILESVRGAR